MWEKILFKCVHVPTVLTFKVEGQGIQEVMIYQASAGAGGLDWRHVRRESMKRKSRINSEACSTVCIEREDNY